MRGCPVAVHQDDKAQKLKGVGSLIKYATMCAYMLVPTEEKEFSVGMMGHPMNLPGYGARGWW